MKKQKYYREHDEFVRWSPIQVWGWNKFYSTDTINSAQKSGYIWRFIKKNPEFAGEEFEKFVLRHNKAGCDAGELEGIAKHEILRLAYEFVEHKHRCPNCYYDDTIWDD